MKKLVKRIYVKGIIKKYKTFGRMTLMAGMKVKVKPCKGGLSIEEIK